MKRKPKVWEPLHPDYQKFCAMVGDLVLWCLNNPSRRNPAEDEEVIYGFPTSTQFDKIISFFNEKNINKAIEEKEKKEKGFPYEEYYLGSWRRCSGITQCSPPSFIDFK